MNGTSWPDIVGVGRQFTGQFHKDPLYPQPARHSNPGIVSMMDFSSIFDVFSKRPQPPVKADRPLTREFRYRVLRLCTTTFPDRPFGHALSRSADTIFWLEMYEKLSYLHGRAKLAKIATSSLSADAAAFLEDCDDYQFLDFIELIFKWQRLWDFNINPHGLLKNVNEFIEVDDLPYYLTEFVFSRPESPKSGLPPGVGVFQSSTQIETYPQIIRRDNEAIHETAIQPALTLLANPAFASANKEFLEALSHYRKGEHADCLAKCGSSFESVIVGNQQKWDTFVKERSGGNGSVVGLPEQVVVAFAAG